MMTPAVEKTGGKIRARKADQMTRTPNTGLLRETLYLLLGLAALAAVTCLYFWLKLPLVSAGFTYLIILVLLSLVSSFLSLAALSLVAVGSLNYFFAPPIFSFRVDYPEDIIAIVAFLITSLIITGLVRRVRAEQAEHTLTSDRLRNAQSQLTHLDRVATIGLLAASIAHEIKQPISATVTNAQAALRWLDRQPPNLEEVRQALNRIVKDGNHAGEVIDRIRALIMKSPPRKDHLEINEAIREVVELTRGEVVKNGISVKTELVDGLPLVQGDRVQLQQVILNLIINAIEAMCAASEGARELVINTEKADSRSVLVAVRDSGPGLPPAPLERLFEPFYTTKSSGLGLGLSICRLIVEEHGGRFWASANLSRGAVFQFTVPAHPGSAS
jgi:C4-dicarboxylate-specific signal transduction histidine kinase